jgi:hypothetical protein
MLHSSQASSSFTGSFVLTSTQEIMENAPIHPAASVPYRRMQLVILLASGSKESAGKRAVLQVPLVLQDQTGSKRNQSAVSGLRSRRRRTVTTKFANEIVKFW